MDELTLDFYRNTDFYKIMNYNENHYGFQYVDGLNVLKEEFNDDPEVKCGPGGLYFATAEHLSKYTSHASFHIRKVMLPLDDRQLKVVDVGMKFRANRIILSDKITDLKQIFHLLKEYSVIYFKHQLDYAHKLSWEFIKTLELWRPLITDDIVSKFLTVARPYEIFYLTDLGIEWKHVVTRETLKGIVQNEDNITYIKHPETSKKILQLFKEMDVDFHQFVTPESMKNGLKMDRLYNWRFYEDLSIQFKDYIDDEIILGQIEKENFRDYAYFDEYGLKWKHLVTEEFIKSRLVVGGVVEWRKLDRVSIDWRHLVTEDLLKSYLAEPYNWNETLKMLTDLCFEWFHLLPSEFWKSAKSGKDPKLKDVVKNVIIPELLNVL